MINNNKGRLSSILPVVVALMLMAILFVVISGCNNSQSPTKNITKIPIRLSTYFTAIDYAPYVVAKKKGWFKDIAGYEVIHLDPFQSPASVNESFSGNKVDGVFTAEIPTIAGRAAGNDVKIGWLCATLQSQIVVRKDVGVASLASLKGKKIALMAGTGPHYGLMRSLKEIGASRNYLEIFNMVPPDARAAFRSGQVDAWAIWPPFVEQEVLSGVGKLLPDVRVPVQIVLCVNGDFARKHRDALNELIKILERSHDWIRKNPEQAQAMLAEDLGLPVEVVKSSWPKIEWDVSLSPAVVEDMQAKANFLKKEGFIENSVNVGKDLLLK